MVFITLGTQGNQFPRCLQMVEELIDSLHPDQVFIAQLGNTKYKSDKIKCLDFVPETEFKELTGIGNRFRIRHHERDKIDIVDDNYFDYFFNRCLSLISLTLKFV